MLEVMRIFAYLIFSALQLRKDICINWLLNWWPLTDVLINSLYFIIPHINSIHALGKSHWPKIDVTDTIVSQVLWLLSYRSQLSKNQLNKICHTRASNELTRQLRKAAIFVETRISCLQESRDTLIFFTYDKRFRFHIEGDEAPCPIVETAANTSKIFRTQDHPGITPWC